MAGLAGLDDLLRGAAGSPDAIRKLLNDLFVAANTDDICVLVRRVVSDDVNIGTSREVTMHFAEALKTLPPELVKNVSPPVLDLLQPRLHSFEAQANQIRETVADVYFEEDDYPMAARILEAIQTDPQSTVLTSEKKMEINVKIAQLYLEGDDHIKAETFINRATRLAAENTGNKNLTLQYKACHVRVADKKRKYVVAAQRYYQLSLESVVDFKERMDSLTYALNCAVLALAGPVRARLLAMLYKDERATNLKFFSLLERMYLGQIVKKQQIKEFEEQLADHHKAVLQDGVTTVLDRAMMEHNIVAASKIYRNISFKELGGVLGVDAFKAERMTADMIAEERLEGRIDQLAGFVHFGGYDVMTSWNDRIRAICIEANTISDRCNQHLTASQTA